MSHDGLVHDRFGCLPITLDDEYVCVWNGKDKEPCALQVHNVKGKKIVRVKKICREWCRLLASKPAFTRPLTNLQIWKEWTAAKEEEIKSMATKISKDTMKQQAAPASHKLGVSWKCTIIWNHPPE